MSVPSLAAGIIISLLAFAGPAVMVAAATPAADSAPGAAVSTRYVTVQGIKVFYREAGSRNAPSIVLLHGFPHVLARMVAKPVDFVNTKFGGAK